jgi:hypothetical protein
VDGLGEHVQGFRRDRSIFTNAAIHCRKAKVATADIHEFFDNIRLAAVVEVFQSVGCARECAVTLAHICCLNGRLPQGGRASPVIANLALRRLDAEFLQHAKAGGFVYTRYADDLAFSGDDVPTETFLAEILVRHGFRLKPGSYRLVEDSRGRWVTGLNVSGSIPMISQKKRRRIERMLHAIERYGPRAFAKKRGDDSVQWLDGNVLWLKKYDPQGQQWSNRLEAAAKAEEERLR